MESRLHVYPLNGKEYFAEPMYLIHKDEGVSELVNDKISELGLVFRLNKILPEKGEIILAIAEVKPEQDYIVMKAIVFPFINLVWLGTIMTVAGFLVSLARIFQKKKSTIKNAEAL